MKKRELYTIEAKSEGLDKWISLPSFQMMGREYSRGAWAVISSMMHPTGKVWRMRRLSDDAIVETYGPTKGPRTNGPRKDGGQ